ncbi:MAG: hypothetical protein LAT57_08860 [Balneolales bacterium]|nr:hypothetical protein [Balneolales bacterium]
MNRIEYIILAILGIGLVALLVWIIITPGIPFFGGSSSQTPAPIVVQRIVGEAVYTNQNTAIQVGDTIRLNSKIQALNRSQVFLRVGNRSYAELRQNFVGSLQASESQTVPTWNIENGSIRYRMSHSDTRVPTGLVISSGRLDLSTSSIQRVNYPYSEVEISVLPEHHILSVPAGPAIWTETRGTLRVDSGRKLTHVLSTGEQQFSDMPPSVVIRSPEDDTSFLPGFMLRGFNLLWNENESERYTIRIFRDGESVPFRQISTSETGNRVQNLTEGTYQFQVGNRASDGHVGGWSDLLSIRVAGRANSELNCSEAPNQRITASVVQRDDFYYLTGCAPGFNPEAHMVNVYGQTDIWWILPMADNFRISIQPDGYFESVINPVSELYVMVVESGYEAPASLRERRFLPGRSETKVKQTQFIAFDR